MHFRLRLQKGLHAALVKICTSGDDPLFHSCDDGVVVREMLPAGPNRWKLDGATFGQCDGCGRNSPVKLLTVFHGLQTYVGPDFIALQ
jgi:hypothetical protein